MNKTAFPAQTVLVAKGGDGKAGGDYTCDVRNVLANYQKGRRFYAKHGIDAGATGFVLDTMARAATEIEQLRAMLDAVLTCKHCQNRETEYILNTCRIAPPPTWTGTVLDCPQFLFYKDVASAPNRDTGAVSDDDPTRRPAAATPDGNDGKAGGDQQCQHEECQGGAPVCPHVKEAGEQ